MTSPPFISKMSSIKQSEYNNIIEFQVDVAE